MEQFTLPKPMPKPMKKPSTNNLSKFWPSLGLCFGAALLGGLFTTPAVNGWYLLIAKPSWTPPNWLFGPVWTLLYLMMAISLNRIWSKGINGKTRGAVTYFFIQLALNTLWSFLFFGQGLLWLAYFEVLAMWLFILLTIKSFWKLDKVAAWLLLPYLFWVTFASFLNLAVARLN